MSETNNLENPILAVGAAGNNLPANPGPYRDRVDSPDSSNHGLPTGGQLPATDARAASPPLATHPYGTPVYATEARAVPHFLESRIALPKYNPEPFGRKPVKIKTQNLQGVMFNGTNMEIGDFITRVERAAQLDGAQGSDICLQIVFFMQGESLAKEVQEMVKRENYDWEKLKERFVQRWGSMMPLLKHTRAELDTFIAQAQAFGINTQQQFQDFSIKLDNLVAYLLRCRQMTNVEDIRHAVLTCIERPIRIAVTKELIRDNQMQQAIDGSHILPPYRTIMEYIGRELKTMSILDIDNWSKEAQKAPVKAPRAPQAYQAPPRDRAMDDLSKTLAGWNVQRPPGFTSASHVPYKPAQYERPPSTLKCHYCFGDAHTSYRCNLFSQDEHEKKVYRDGRDFKLPNGTLIHSDRSRPVKAVVERFAALTAPVATPGIINLPPGTQVQKEELATEVRSSFGKLEECEPNMLSSYEADMAKRMRNGKDIPETPSAKKMRQDAKEDMDVDNEIMAITNKDYDPFPGYKEAQVEKASAKKVQFKDSDSLQQAKEKPTRKSFLEKTLAKEYPEADDRVVQRMVGEGRLELSYGEIFAISNGVTEAFKKKISRKKVPIKAGADKQTSLAGVDSEDESEEDREDDKEAKRSHYACPLGYIKIGINGKEVQALLDNGSMVNVLPKELAVRLGLIVTERAMNLKGIGGHKNEILGIAESVRVKIGNIKRSVQFWISGGDVQPILGKPFLIDVSAAMKYVGGGGETLSINDDEGRTYLVPIVTPTNQKWETTFPTNMTSSSNIATTAGSVSDEQAFGKQTPKQKHLLGRSAQDKLVRSISSSIIPEPADRDALNVSGGLSLEKEAVDLPDWYGVKEKEQWSTNSGIITETVALPNLGVEPARQESTNSEVQAFADESLTNTEDKLESEERALGLSLNVDSRSDAQGCSGPRCPRFIDKSLHDTPKTSLARLATLANTKTAALLKKLLIQGEHVESLTRATTRFTDQWGDGDGIAPFDLGVSVRFNLSDVKANCTTIKNDRGKSAKDLFLTSKNMTERLTEQKWNKELSDSFCLRPSSRFLRYVRADCISIMKTVWDQGANEILLVLIKAATRKPHRIYPTELNEALYPGQLVHMLCWSDAPTIKQIIGTDFKNPGCTGRLSLPPSGPLVMLATATNAFARPPGQTIEEYMTPHKPPIALKSSSLYQIK
ncbi:hypothetical protein PSTG_05860 [Puccinia striiformis f. sp. tritici PST-78]|uniref:Peptidase A2 domain-containing protein n=1 Tax=Puccinia striiformis f. sp. tritici PST-78 TaxID=1165861 RepID=A0A0L0VNZ4_9BASI|nr:hypothetical protein PSTG_05860 [Puccinia striiformis f. sp. tritici PST-78]